MEEQGRDRSQLQIGGVEVGAPLDHPFSDRLLVSDWVAFHPLDATDMSAYGFDHTDIAVGRRPIHLGYQSRSSSDWFTALMSQSKLSFLML